MGFNFFRKEKKMTKSRMIAIGATIGSFLLSFLADSINEKESEKELEKIVDKKVAAKIRKMEASRNGRCSG